MTITRPNGQPATCAYCGFRQATHYAWDDTRRQRYTCCQHCAWEVPAAASKNVGRKCATCGMAFIDVATTNRRCFRHRKRSAA